MLSKGEIEKARSNILRGNDIESACLIMEEVICNDLVITGGRVNIVKVAMRQILNFIEECKDKGYLDIVKEKVQLKERNNELEQENSKLNKVIDEMAKWIFDKDYTENSLLISRDDYYGNCVKQVKQYFEKKVEEK